MTVTACSALKQSFNLTHKTHNLFLIKNSCNVGELFCACCLRDRRLSRWRRELFKLDSYKIQSPCLLPPQEARTCRRIHMTMAASSSSSSSSTTSNHSSVTLTEDDNCPKIYASGHKRLWRDDGEQKSTGRRRRERYEYEYYDTYYWYNTIRILHTVKDIGMKWSFPSIHPSRHPSKQNKYIF